LTCRLYSRYNSQCQRMKSGAQCPRPRWLGKGWSTPRVAAAKGRGGGKNRHSPFLRAQFGNCKRLKVETQTSLC
jgi:hypothetical protein